MSNFLSTYSQNNLLAWFANTAFPSAPATLYFALHNGDPSPTGTSNDITGSTLSGRASFTSSQFTSPTVNGTFLEIDTNAGINFGTSTASGSASYYSVWSASSGGNCLGRGQIQNSSGVATPLTYGSGASVSLASGSVRFRLPLGVFSNFLATQLLNWFKGTTFYSGGGLPNSYLGLHTAIASDGTTTEISSTVSTGRKTIASTDWTSPATSGISRQIKNTPSYDFGSALASAAGWQFIGLWDTYNNLLAYTSLTSPIDIVTGQQILIPSQSLILSVS